MAYINEYYPTHWYEYGPKYEDWLKLRFEDGILEVRFHTDGGPCKWSSGPQAAIDNICYEINHDPDVEIVIITGTGDAFFAGNLNLDDPRAERAGWFADSRTPLETFDYWYHYQTQEPLNIMNLQVPVIAAVNGGQHVHPEITLCSDICIASENAFWTEFHYAIAGVAPGDGAWPIWRELIGMNRARALMYLGGKITAKQLYDWGVLQEILPIEKLNERAWEIARQLLQKPRYSRRLTRALLSKRWKQLFLDELESGLAHEGYGVLCDAPFWTDAQCRRDVVTDAESDAAGSEYVNK